MSKKVAWGVLGVANIGIKKVIPAMQRGEWCEIAAIASRDLEKAERAAKELGIGRAYSSYEEMLADPAIEVIYNPLPNHLHVPWSIKAAEAGKHVLCEKPISLDVPEALTLLAARDRTGVKIQEAFMVGTHPQWLKAVDLVRSGTIGNVRSVAGAFSYFNRDPKNIRNIADYGGGALMDIGCYLVYTSRLIFGEEPKRVVSLIERDPEWQTDILTSGLLEFPSGHSIFTCGTQVVPYQKIQIFGAQGRVEIEIPFNAPPDKACRIYRDDGRDPSGRSAEIIEFDVCDQYTIQGDLFSKSIREGTPNFLSLESSIRNMAVIDAVVRSAKTSNWEQPLTHGV
jgi:predicted dehydrogenase